MKKVAINGFGRIGRIIFKILENDQDVEVVAINDLTDAEQLAYLLKYDTTFRYNETDKIAFAENYLIFNDRKIKILSEKDPLNLPWKEMNIDLVIECTGHFTDYEGAKKHIDAGAKKVIISAPAKGDIKTIVYGVNQNILDGTEEIISAASCTTNCLAPVLKVLNDNFTIIKGNMTTVHAYTNDQVILDVPHSKGIYSRRCRAAAMNIIPTSTGAATAIKKVIPALDGKLTGTAIRVPVQDGSMVDLVVLLNDNTTKEEINETFIKNESKTLKTTNEPIVSSDIIGNSCGCLVDLLSTEANGNFVHIIAWYDNEYGYSSQLVRTLKYLLKKNDN